MLNGILYLLKFCWKHNKKFIAYEILYSIVNAAIPFFVIVVPKYMIDELLGDQNRERLLLYIGIFCLGNFAGGFLTKFFMAQALNQKNILFSKFQLNLCSNLIDADYQQLESADYLQMKEKAYKYIYGNGKGFASLFDDFSGMISQVFTVLGLMTILASLHILVLLVLLVGLALSAYLDFRYQKVQFDLNMEKVDVERKNSYFLHLVESFEYGKELRIYTAKEWMKEKYADTLYVLNQFYKRMTNALIKNSFGKSVSGLLEQGMVYAYLVYRVLQKTIGIGDFTMYASAVSTITSSAKLLLESGVRILKSESYYKELDAFLNLPKTMQTGTAAVADLKGRHTIEFIHVSFRYPNQTANVLQDISVKLTTGERVSIVGENGAGKTTFIKLLMRLYDPTEGEILLDGVNIKAYAYEQYLGLFSAVFQDFRLFAFSIRDNVALGLDWENQERAEASLANSGILEKVHTLQNGMETSIFKIFDKNGIEFSGGEGQKIALARALYKDSGIVILDEPTSALDARAEYELFRNFNQFVDGKLAIYISHRLSSAKLSDVILVFRNGQICEQGGHDQLIAKKGLYAELFEMQAGQYV